MEQHEALATAEARRFATGVVSLVSEQGFWVRWPKGGQGGCRCQLLVTSSTPVQLVVGDQVLVWMGDEGSGDGVILGRIQETKTEELGRNALSDELVLEAKQQITIKCGDGSITIREDGKVLIKGKDLVSRAQRTNRVKGGSVAIN